MNTPWDGSCRGNKMGRIIEVLKEHGQAMTLRELADQLGIGVAYARSLVNMCEDTYCKVTLLPVGSYQVWLIGTVENDSGKET